MGVCGSKGALHDPDEAKRNEKIEKVFSAAMQEDRMIRKLLLLGAGESGKSTLFKQMVKLYGQGYSAQELASYTSCVHHNTIEAVKTLVYRSADFQDAAANDPDLHDKEREDYAKCAVSPEARRAFAEVEEMDAHTEINDQVANNIATLWADPGIQATFALRSHYQLVDSAGYFFDKIQELAHPAYVPSFQDYLRARVRTTGIVETHFTLDSVPFMIVDVGGQRSERKKWVHCFDSVTAVLFVAALSGYDMTLFEDDQTNRLDESLKLFEDMANSKTFCNTAFIMFLNKRDLFVKKIMDTPLTVWRPEYDGPPGNADAGMEYITMQFESKNLQTTRTLYFHYTTATDTDLVQNVFNSVKDLIVQSSLRDSGLLE